MLKVKKMWFCFVSDAKCQKFCPYIAYLHLGLNLNP